MLIDQQNSQQLYLDLNQETSITVNAIETRDGENITIFKINQF